MLAPSGEGLILYQAYDKATFERTFKPLPLSALIGAFFLVGLGLVVGFLVEGTSFLALIGYFLEGVSSNEVWICQISQENSQKRTRERMSDQEAKDLKAEAREIMPQPSTVNCRDQGERELMDGQDGRRRRIEKLNFGICVVIDNSRLDTLGIGWQLIDQGFRAVGQHIGQKRSAKSSLDHEFKEFMAIKIEEIPEQEEEVEDNFEELHREEKLRIKNSIQDPPTDLVMKPLPKHLEYAFLEK
ncbi:hypothetical protein Tco_0484790 [Tanacetum coccineum]